MQALLDALAGRGFGIDVVGNLAAARTAFFGCGGHHCLLIGPDVAEATANAIASSLRGVDPNLPALSFGPELDAKGSESRTACLQLHPGSRAGQGALLRFLSELPERG